MKHYIDQQSNVTAQKNPKLSFRTEYYIALLLLAAFCSVSQPLVIMGSLFVTFYVLAVNPWIGLAHMMLSAGVHLGHRMILESLEDKPLEVLLTGISGALSGLLLVWMFDKAISYSDLYKHEVLRVRNGGFLYRFVEVAVTSTPSLLFCIFLLASRMMAAEINFSSYRTVYDQFADQNSAWYLAFLVNIATAQSFLIYTRWRVHQVAGRSEDQGRTSREKIASRINYLILTVGCVLTLALIFVGSRISPFTY